MARREVGEGLVSGPRPMMHTFPFVPGLLKLASLGDKGRDAHTLGAGTEAWVLMVPRDQKAWGRDELSEVTSCLWRIWG